MSPAPPGQEAPGSAAIDRLYDPASRRSAFPQADWRFLVRASANLARAFARVHEAGAVVGDVDPGAIMVGADARVWLVGGPSPHGAGSPAFTAPELQDEQRVGAIRREDHDTFGLAVTIFLVLFMGRHPFVGRYLGEGEMPLGRAIREHRFAYGAEHDFAAMEQPPGTPPLAIVSPPVAELFERAFAMSAEQDGRPSALDWGEALEALSDGLVQCRMRTGHWYFAGLPECPWCRIEAVTGVPTFVPAEFQAPPIPAAHAAPVLPSTLPPPLPAPPPPFDLAAVWQHVLAMPHPGPAPDLSAPAEVPRPSRAARRLVFRRNSHGAIALVLAVIPAGLSFSVHQPPLGRSLFFLAAVVIYVLVRLILRRTVDTKPFAVRERDCRKHWGEALADWESEAGPRRFEDKRRELEKLKDWWEEAAVQPQQRNRIEPAIRRAFDELQQIAARIELARSSLREPAEQAYERLLQAEVDLAIVQKKR